MRQPKYYEFDGRQCTVRQVHELFPHISRARLGEHLKAGRNTTAAIRNYDGQAGLRAAGRKGRKASGEKLHFRSSAR